MVGEKVEALIQPLLRFISRLSFESVTVAFSVLSIGYASRLVILDGFFSQATDSVVFVQIALPVETIAALLALGGLFNILAVYWQRSWLFYASTYLVLLVWSSICVSFFFVSVLSLHFFISSYVILVYAWILWKAQGLVSPKP